MAAYGYTLTNDRRNVLYIGSTKDLKSRVRFHRRLIPGVIKKYNLYRMVYYQVHANLHGAEAREELCRQE